MIKLMSDLFTGIVVILVLVILTAFFGISMGKAGVAGLWAFIIINFFISGLYNKATEILIVTQKNKQILNDIRVSLINNRRGGIMANRDGRTAKHSKVNFRKGQICPHCGKSKLDKSSCKCRTCRRGHKNVECPTCHWTNF
jgi:predicted RNA-binding Zn-ribbon protein involved in translation (DUF1610 family)